MRTLQQTHNEPTSSPCHPFRLVRDKPTHQTQDIFAGQSSLQAQRMRAEIQRVARRPFNILITGETGTGKTEIARQIHRLSIRSTNPFIELNCANLPEHLVEAELFGHRKGAFTGADHDRMGLFEEANGGTLFLDEIGDITPAVQNRLLKAIDEKRIKRLGTNHYISCDVQIVAATSRSLPLMINAREFREDLYYRLAVLSMETAPLKDRRDDIPAMVALFLREAASSMPQLNSPYRIDEPALALLCEFEYPGNVRTLRNLVYELTSYVEDDEPISVELVRFVFAKLNHRVGNVIIMNKEWHEVNKVADGNYASNGRNLSTFALEAWLRSLASEGDIILPIELCLLRRGETFKQWTARAKRSSIEAARSTTGGTMQSVAKRLGLTRNSLMGHLNRAKRDQNEVLFDWKCESG